MHTYIREREIGKREAWGDGEDGEQREGERTTEHARETRETGRRRTGRGQCRRTEPEAGKFGWSVYLQSFGHPTWLVKTLPKQTNKKQLGGVVLALSRPKDPEING